MTMADTGGFLRLPFESALDAYEQYTALGWKTQTFQLALDLNLKKKPTYHFKWKEEGNRFRPDDNGMQVVTGAASNLVVLDIDANEAEAGKANGMDTWRDWCSGHPDIQTLTVKTQSGGLHLYFKTDSIRTDSPILKNKQGLDAAGIDIRAEGGVIFAPPTHIQANGQTHAYTIHLNTAPTDVPSWLLEALESACAPSIKSAPKVRTRVKLNYTLPISEGTCEHMTDFAKVAKAQQCLTTMINATDETNATWDKHDIMTRIIWACANVCNGQPLLIPDLICLCKKSPKANDTVSAWVTTIWNQADLTREDRPGLPTLIHCAKQCAGHREEAPGGLIVGSPYESALTGLVIEHCDGYSLADAPLYIKRPADDSSDSIVILEPSSKRQCIQTSKHLNLTIDKLGHICEVCNDEECQIHPRLNTNIPPYMMAFINTAFTFNQTIVGNPNDALVSTMMPEHTLRAYNERYAIVTEGSVQRVVDMKRTTWVFLQYEEFVKKNSNDVELLEKAGAKIKATWARLWLEHHSARRYDYTRFYPGGDRVLPDNTLNLWRGFAVHPNPDGDCSLYLKLLFEGICKCDKILYEYVINWMAFGVQKPAELAETAIVMQGGQGCGKGTIAQHYGRLFGKSFIHISNSGHFTGNFNAAFEYCKFLFVDEATYGGDRREAGNIKIKITEKTQRIERKGIDHYQADSFLHIMISSNNDWAVPVEKDDRRFVCIKPSDKFKNDFDFFVRLNAQMDNGGAGGLFHMLMTRDISEFAPRMLPKSVEVEKQRTAMKIESLDAIPAFIHSLIASDNIPEYEIRSSYLFDNFQREMRGVKDIRGITINKFSRVVDTIITDIKHKRKMDGIYKTFPDKETCKINFAKWLNCSEDDL
jgi:hypothetical protein